MVEIPVQPKNWFTLLSVYVTLLIPEIIYPLSANPMVESTGRTDEPTDTFWVALVAGVISNVPLIVERSSFPINNETLKYCWLFLVNGSTSDTEALVPESVDLKIVCPINLIGLPDIASAIVTYLLR